MFNQPGGMDNPSPLQKTSKFFSKKIEFGTVFVIV